jgi:uncharacterized protein DUF4956
MNNMFHRLLRHGPMTCPSRVLGAPTRWRLIGCYIVAAIYIVAIDLVAPLTDRGVQRVWSLEIERFLAGTATGALHVPVWVDALLALTGAFVLIVPIVIVYVRTRTHAVFDESLANTVLVLPAIVTAILIVVRNSLALAFSLAGIVAAVRFRISLKESRDALYIFAAVAIGFAAGIYRLDVGLVASVVFVLLEILTWRTDLGADSWSDEDMPKEKKKDKEKGKSARANGADTGADARDVLLRIQVTNAERGREAVEPLLGDLTKAWQRAARAGVDGGGGGGSPTLLEYSVRLRKRYPADEVRSRLLRDGQALVVGVEVLAPLQAAAPAAS